MISPINRIAFDAQQLVTDYPPRIVHRNKLAVHRKACPPDAVHSGSITFTRWCEMDLSACRLSDTSPCKVEHRAEYFDYKQSGGEVVEWHLNFAHSEVFAFYGGPLFAQDEMQVAEHPALGSLREALLQKEIKPLTVENHNPTPVLVMGVERRCRVATDTNAKLGRPQGLYGNAFARATVEAIEQATTLIVPPTISNILAIEAPAGGIGRYRVDDIGNILITAYTGFRVAGHESNLGKEVPFQVVINTGFWGCGAYGGNRVLMTLLQLLAARLAGIDRLVFHTGDIAGTPDFQKGLQLMNELEAGSSNKRVYELAAQIESMGFAWGEGDGN